jgi:hypothetical protein
VYLRDIDVYADETIVTRFPSGFVGWFHRETCCITQPYIAVLGKKVFTPDTGKVFLTFTDPKESTPRICRCELGVLEAEWPFLFARYAEGDDVQKKCMILDGVHSAVLWVGKERGWDVRSLAECRDEIIRRDFVFEGWSKKSWASPDRKFRAKIGFQFELRRVDLVLGVFDRKGREIGRKPLGWAVPQTGVLYHVLKANGTWTNENIFQIQSAVRVIGMKNTQEVDLSDLISCSD